MVQYKIAMRKKLSQKYSTTSSTIKKYCALNIYESNIHIYVYNLKFKSKINIIKTVFRSSFADNGLSLPVNSIAIYNI